MLSRSRVVIGCGAVGGGVTTDGEADAAEADSWDVDAEGVAEVGEAGSAGEATSGNRGPGLGTRGPEVGVDDAGPSAWRMQGDIEPGGVVDPGGDDEAVPAVKGELHDGSVSKEISYRRMRSSTIAGWVTGKMEGGVGRRGSVGCDCGEGVANGNTCSSKTTSREM